MNEKKINPKTLSGDALFHYCTNDHEDKVYSSIVELLPIATAWDMEKAYQILEKAVKEDKKLVAVYPGNEKSPVKTEGMTFVGSIPDGVLYVE